MRRRFALLAAIPVLGATSLAAAATPVGDGTYIAELKAADAAVGFLVAPDSKSLEVFIACGDNKVVELGKTTINGSGAFSKTSKGVKVKASFVTRRKASGTISTSKCDIGNNVGFTAKQ